MRRAGGSCTISLARHPFPGDRLPAQPFPARVKVTTAARITFTAHVRGDLVAYGTLASFRLHPCGRVTPAHDPVFTAGRWEAAS